MNEPNDKPIGEGLERFERNFEKEKEKLESAVETLLLVKQNTRWSGQKEIIGNKGLPQSIADFDPSLLGMVLTDSVKRDSEGRLSRTGKANNLTNRMITLVNKLFNKVPNLLQDIQLGIINKPLDEYTDEFESGLIDGGEYISGELTEDASTVSIINSSTYSPLTDQDTVVDADLYINI